MSNEAPRISRLHKDYFNRGKAPETGVIYSVTKPVDTPPHEGWVAIIEQGNGSKLVAGLTDSDNPQIGGKAEPVVRKLAEPDGERGAIVYGYKYRTTSSSK